MKAYFLIALAGCILTAGDLVQKQWVTTGKTWIFWLGIAIWAFGSLFLAMSYKYKNMAVASMIYILVNILTLVVISWVAYGEKLDTKQMVGMGLALIAVFLLE